MSALQPRGLRVTVHDDVRDVHLDVAVAPGRTLAVVGPNGAGKSTLLSVVAGLYVPTSARVVLTDAPAGAPDRVLTDTAAGTRVPPERRGVVLLGQRPELFGHLSVRANVAFGPRSAGLRRADARNVAARWLDAVGARELARRRARALSGGQAQRVAIARAFAAEPSVVLLDEPLAAVDAPSVPHLRDVLRRALADATALVVTHDVADALALADDVVVLDRGRIVEHGPAAEVLDDPRSAFLRQLPGTPSAGAGRLGPVSTAPRPQDPTTHAGERDAEGAEHARRTVEEHAGWVAAALGPALAVLATPSRAAEVAVADAVTDPRPRLLAADAVASVATPGFDNAQMDGYAVRSADLVRAAATSPVGLVVAEPIPAGHVGGALAAGAAAPIMTGAPVPEGADAVVRIEDALPPRFGQTTGDRVSFTAPVEPGTFVRPAGSDSAAGDVVLAAGSPLGPAQLGALVASGVGAVRVAAAPRVLLVSTGSEVVAAGDALGPGQVHDANGASLAAALRTVGAEVRARTVADDVAVFRAALAALGDDGWAPDVVVTTGGVSAGAYEVVRLALGAMAEDGLADAWFGHVAMQPGGPQGLASVVVGPEGADGARRVPLVAFPGNPVSALVSFELFLRPLLARATGLRPARRGTGRAPIADAVDSPPAVHQVRRGVLDDAGRVVLVGGPGSHLLARYAAATVLVHVPLGVAHLDAGDEVEYEEIG
ncbi:gephyrin-like molybdotransferase Glp [Luteimicrobium sp. NPDC057192]|uniref:ATP-binding cassette domain-containing protein n=1 Tax=Luteimicrobium sp. NPDC057192 TaxID=3346042 RepID=UPI003641300F